MKWNRGIATWLVSIGILGGIAILFVLPVWLQATPTSDQSRPVPSSEPSPYDPEVQHLLETTYLGHAAGLPDPGEPAVVLQKYLEQNAHGYHSLLAADSKKLDSEVAAWEDLTKQYPESRHAYVGLAKHYRTKALATGDIQYTRQAADAYIQAADLAMAHGRIRYTRELSTLLVELGDREGLDEIFGQILAQPKDMDRNRYYLALVHYANGLARFSDDRAWDYFEEAINFHPENNDEAVNLYAQSLLDRGQGEKALDLLDTHFTPEQRIESEIPAFLRKQALELAGLDTASADAELALIRERSSNGPVMGSSPVPSASANSKTVEAELAFPDNEVFISRSLSTGDSRVSTIFAARASASTVGEDAIFSPNGAMNNRWPDMLPTVTANKLATLKWPNSTRAGLVRISTDNRVYYRYFNGSAWEKIECPGSSVKVDWCALSVLPNGHSAIDIAAVVYANNQADIFAVANDNCTIYSSRSVNGTTWGAWQWWGACGDNITAAIMPDGTGFAAIRATQAGNQAAVRYFNGSTWAGSWTGIGGIVNDLALLAYANPAQIGGIRMGLSAVGSDNCTVYGNNWNGSSWSGWFSVASCYKQVSAFNTSDGGAYQLFIGSNDQLSTQRFTGSAWAGIVPQGGMRKWIATAGVNIDDEAGNAYEHTEFSDDCRPQNATPCFPDPNGIDCWTAPTINLAEIIYNEAQGETRGAQAMVGWTVRNRAFQSLKTPSTCGTYPGAEGGGTVTADCRDKVRVSDPNFPQESKQYCCAMHGGQFLWGTSGYQFNDEHVPFDVLRTGGFINMAFRVLNGWVLDMSNPSWKPSGIPGCPQTPSCGTPTSTTGGPFCTYKGGVTNVRELPPGGGPMEFRGNDYCASTNGAPLSSCKWYAGDVCGNHDSPPEDGDPVEVPRYSTTCAQTGASRDNFFWNRQP
jgi:hypothetical protein